MHILFILKTYIPYPISGSLVQTQSDLIMYINTLPATHFTAI